MVKNLFADIVLWITKQLVGPGLYDDDAAAWHVWFAWHSVLCADINGVRTHDDFFIRKQMTNVYRRSAPATRGRQWVYCFEDPYDGYER